MEFFIRRFHRAGPAREPGRRAALAPLLPTTSSAPRRPCAVVPSPVLWTRPRSGPIMSAQDHEKIRTREAIENCLLGALRKDLSLKELPGGGHDQVGAAGR